MEATNRAARRAEKQAQYEKARQAQLRRAFEKPAPKQQPKQAAPVKAKVEVETVKLRDGAEFVIILNLWHKDVPKELQMTPVAGGGGRGPEVKREKIDFHMASIDMNGLMTRCYVDRIHISKDHVGFCKVYVNCIVGVNGKYQGFGPWAGQYEQLVRRELLGTLPRVIVRYEEGKTSLEIPRKKDEEATTKIQFAIDRS